MIRGTITVPKGLKDLAACRSRSRRSAHSRRAGVRRSAGRWAARERHLSLDGPAAHPGKARGWAAVSLRLSEGWFALLLVLPALLGIFVVVLFPLLYSLWLSFTDVNLLRSTGPAIELFGVRVPLFRFVGLQNYVRVFEDPLYWSSLWRTLYFVGAFVLEATLMGLGMALVLNERFGGRPLMRSLLLIPWSLSRVVVGLLWVGILDFEFGALNGLLHNLGLIDRSISFFKDGFTALNVLVSVYMWNQAPFAALLFLAGMQSVSRTSTAPPRWTAPGTGSVSAT